MSSKPLLQSRTIWAALVTSGATLIGARLGLTAEEVSWVATLGLAIIAELRRRDSLKARVDAAVAKKVGAAALIVFAVTGCATTFACKSDVQVELRDKAVVVKCIDGSAPTVTVTAAKVVGP